MIGLLIQVIALIVCGRFFSELAFDNNRNRWLYGGLAILGGFVLMSVFVTLQFMIFKATGNAMFVFIPFVMETISICLTAITLFFIYKAVERRWEKTPVDDKRSDKILDR